nr:response regulator transcription factor [Rhodoferax sp.]
MTVTPTTARSKLLLADDHPLIRSGMRAQLEPLGNFEIEEAWDAHSLESALSKAQSRKNPFDLALVDVMMPGMQGIESLVHLCSHYADVAFIVVTGLDVQAIIRRCRNQTNIRGVIDKGRSTSELRRLVDLAMMGIPIWADGQDIRASGSSLSTPAPTGNLQPAALSARMDEVANCVARGLSNAQVAHELGLTEGTVKAYLKDIFKTLGVSNRTQLSIKMQERR